MFAIGQYHIVSFALNACRRRARRRPRRHHGAVPARRADGLTAGPGGRSAASRSGAARGRRRRTRRRPAAAASPVEQVGDAALDARRLPGVAVDVAAGGGHAEHAGDPRQRRSRCRRRSCRARSRRARRPSRPAVMTRCAWLPTTMSAPASTSAPRELLLARRRARRALDAPVQVRRRSCRRRRAPRGCRRPAGRLVRRPSADASPPCVSVAVHDAMSQSSITSVAPKTAMRWPFTVRHPRRVRLGRVRADADDAERRRGLRRERVREPAGAVVDAVVVRHRHDVDAGDPQRLERARPARGSCSSSGSGVPPSAIAVSRFTIATSAPESSARSGRTSRSGSTSSWRAQRRPRSARRRRTRT